jgi:hypothetical protein
MNWDAVGAIAEGLGAVAVVATLVYLSVQLRQNTATVRSNSATAHTQAVQTFTLAIAQDAELNRLYWSGLANRAGLEDDDERRRFDSILTGMLLTLEQSMRFHEEGVIDDDLWGSQRAGLSWLAHEPGFVNYWKVWGPTHHPRFGAVVAEAMNEELSIAIASAVELTASADRSHSGGET